LVDPFPCASHDQRSLATLSSPPYSLLSSLSNIVVCAQSVPAPSRCSMRQSEASPAWPWPTLRGCKFSSSHKSSSGDSESQNSMGQLHSAASTHVPVAYRQTVGCFVETMASRLRYSFYICWSLRCPYPPTLRIHTHCHHRLFSVSSPPPPSLLIPAVYPFSGRHLNLAPPYIPCDARSLQTDSGF
jgi:hypothetical protein